MNFSEPGLVGNVIQAMTQADLIRATNRALIIDLFNGAPPYTPSEAEQNNISVNVNWREAVVLGHQARRQYEQAFLSPTNFFSVDVENAPVIKRTDWSNFITSKINRCMKKSLPYIQLVRSKFAGVVLHGIGPQYWANKDCGWLPKFIAIEDLMVPTDTDEDLCNLPYFAIRRIYTPGELFRKISGPNVDPGWNIPVVHQILDSIREFNTAQQSYTWLNQPEKMSELWKQNAAYYESDAAPSVTLWDFYHLESEVPKPGWRRCMLQDINGPSVMTNEFVYRSERVIADEIGQILHINFGDLSNKPPFKYHSVRSLGYLLFDVCHMMNRLRCQFTQKVFEDLLTWYRVLDPSDKGRLNHVALFDKGIIPEGLQIVKRDERYSPDAALVNNLMANYRQLMSEASSTFTQDIDNGTAREVTATETMARVNQVNALLSSLLNLAYVQENFAYVEICRRFCNQKSEDPQVKRFQILAQEHGIPKRYLNHEHWNIVPETTLGSGNKILQVAQAKALLEIRPMLDPTPQRLVTHLYAEAVADAKVADQLVNMNAGPKVTDAQHDAQLSFSAMMEGTPVPPLEGVNHVESVQTLIQLMAMKVQRIQQTSNVGTPDDVVGFKLVAQNVSAQLQMLAQDESQKQFVRAMGDALGQIMNEVKAFQERQMEAMKKAQAQNQGDPSAMAKVQAIQAQTQAKIQGKQAERAQDLRHNEIAFRQQQQHEAARTRAEINRDNVKTAAEIEQERALTEQELDDMSAMATVERSNAKKNGEKTSSE